METETNRPTSLPELDALAREVGHFVHYWGFKEIHGRLWTHLFLSRDPLDAGTLMVRLKVSKALMSLSLHDLLGEKVILEAGRSAKGTLTYVANPHVVELILAVLRRRETLLLSRIETTHLALVEATTNVSTPIHFDQDRIKKLGSMIALARLGLDQILELSRLDLGSWREINK